MSNKINGKTSAVPLTPRLAEALLAAGVGLGTIDPVNRPPHYTQHPSGVECIQITEHMNFCRGNAVKYIWRAGEKGDEIEDMEKARWYIDREIARLKRNQQGDEQP